MLFQCTLHNSGLNNDVKLTVNIVERGEEQLLFGLLPGCQLTSEHATQTLRRPPRKKTQVNTI